MPFSLLFHIAETIGNGMKTDTIPTWRYTNEQELGSGQIRGLSLRVPVAGESSTVVYLVGGKVGYGNEQKHQQVVP
jgi:hypothetical protein